MPASRSAHLGAFIERGVLRLDPVQWILESDEPAAIWVVLSGLVDGVDGRAVADAHAAVLESPDVALLIGGLVGWGEREFPGHNSPLFLPNQLNLLADMGIGAGDDGRIEVLLDAMLEHQTEDGRLAAFGKSPKDAEPRWGSLPCDTHAIADVMLRYGRGVDPRVRRSVDRVVEDARQTPQGMGWCCIPGPGTTFRGPGRMGDVCPMVSLEALRVLSQVDPTRRPAWTLDAARTSLEVWRRRSTERPYMFGHGVQFKSVKWPNFWYDVLWVLETLGRCPDLWSNHDAREEDRGSLSEMCACLVAYNLDEQGTGRAAPRRTYRGYERLSLGRKREASPFVTARVLLALSRFSGLAEEVAAVDVRALASSKGGTGSPVPPRPARG